MQTVQAILSVLALVAAVSGAVMWVVQTLRHRSHLNQCVHDLQRHRRLDARLIGCINDMERLLDALAPTVDGEIPEELVGHARYLYGLRVEAADNASHLSRHALRVRWPDGYLSRVTLAGKRCDLAHGALVTAFKSLAEAAREYERGLPQALRHRGDGSRDRCSPMRLLDNAAAAEVARLRRDCGIAAAGAADAIGLRYLSATVFESHWPIFRSELRPSGTDPFDGEIRPMRWQGFGPQALVHVDAQ